MTCIQPIPITQQPRADALSAAQAQADGAAPLWGPPGWTLDIETPLWHVLKARIATYRNMLQLANDNGHPHTMALDRSEIDRLRRHGVSIDALLNENGNVWGVRELDQLLAEIAKADGQGMQSASQGGEAATPDTMTANARQLTRPFA